MKEAREEELRSKFNYFVMKPNEGPQEVYDRLMDIVNKRRALGANLTDLEVNKRLLQALRPWNSTICSNVRDKDNFKSFTTDEVLGRLLSQKAQDEEADNINKLINKIEEDGIRDSP